MKKKLYLANPYGFSKQTNQLLKEFIKIFDNLNIEVYEPFERTKKLSKSSGNWAFKIADFNSINNHLNHHALPSEIKKYFSSRDVNKILSFMTKDKKNKSDKINLILLKKIGLADIKGEYSKENLKVFLKDELSN